MPEETQPMTNEERARTTLEGFTDLVGDRSQLKLADAIFDLAKALDKLEAKMKDE